MHHTRCVRAALPQAVYNPKYKVDPRQVIDPSLHRVVMRRMWMPRKWKVGEEPWEMDPNAQHDFSKRNLADDYADIIRNCLGFADALPYYLELKVRDIPVTTTFMNLLLAFAQRYKEHRSGAGRKVPWTLYQELSENGAKADINTLDLLRTTLHNLCYEYCEEVSRALEVDPSARLTAAMRKALMNVADLPVDTVQSFLSSFKSTPDKSVMRRDDSTEGYDILQTIAGAVPEGQMEAFGTLCEAFLRLEQERISATRQLDAHQEALEKGGEDAQKRRLTPDSLRAVEAEERRADSEKAETLQLMLDLVGSSVETLAERNPFVTDLKPAEVVTGSVPRTTKDGKAIPQRKVPLWEARILVRDDLREARDLICEIRQHLISAYNTLCCEHLHRIGSASDSFRIDPAVGQKQLEEVMKRFRSSLLAMRQLRIYEPDQIAPLRPEITAELSLPIQLSEHGNHTEDVVVGCYIEDDRSLPLTQRCNLSPESARIGLSYYQPLSLISAMRSRGGLHFDLTEFSNQAGLIEGGPSDSRRDSRITMRRRLLNRAGGAILQRREAARRDEDVRRVFSACVERIIERGTATSCWEQVYQIAHLAFDRCCLWPSSELNNVLLSISSSAPERNMRTQLVTMIQNNVRTFDSLVMWVRRDVGALGLGLESPTKEAIVRARRPQGRSRELATFKPHLAHHPVLKYTDSGVDEEFMGMYIRSKPWEMKDNRRTDTEESMMLFESEKKYLEERWKESTGVERNTDGIYFDLARGQIVTVTKGDVPDMAARWEDRLHNLTNTHHTYDALLQICYDELVRETQSQGSSEAKGFNNDLLSKHVSRVIELMEENSVEPASATHSLILALCRRLPEHLKVLEQETLDRMKHAGHELWWQWFEEL
eukprot:TRINITY_DN19106_c0_g2_i1.p1 TRINITY_DN19106_c0_g2~~TRINITY_DN19106_c0_g2_i1.p1  ORF type:complete len:883 (+),score=399.47 TRINITY_DN19106_c0_g2_i1:42-2690(+)